MFNVLDAFVLLRLIGGTHPPPALAAALAELEPLVPEYAEMNRLCDRWRQDVGAGMLLWRASFFPDEVRIQVAGRAHPPRGYIYARVPGQS